MESLEWSTTLSEQQISSLSQEKSKSRQDPWNSRNFDSCELIPDLSPGFHDYDTGMSFSDFQILTPDSATPGQNPSAVVGDSPSSTSYNQSTVYGDMNDADQAQCAIHCSPELPTIITEDKMQDASLDVADDTETCIRELSELALALNQCRRLLFLSNISASTKKNPGPNDSQNAKNRLPAIRTDSIFRCSQKMVDQIQHAKKNIAKDSPSILCGRLKHHGQSHSIQKRHSDDISMSWGASDSLAAHSSSRNVESPARDEAARGDQSGWPFQAPSGHEYERSQNNSFDERTFKTPDTSTLLLFLSCHESLLSIYSMVCGDIQKSLSEITTPHSQKFGSKQAWESHQAMSANGTSPTLLNVSSVFSSPSGTPEPSRMEISMLLSMFVWFIDEIDNIFPEISMPTPDPNGHGSEIPHSQGHVAVDEDNTDGRSKEKGEAAELGNSLINHWVRTKNKSCKKEIKSTMRILKDFR